MEEYETFSRISPNLVNSFEERYTTETKFIHLDIENVYQHADTYQYTKCAVLPSYK